VIETLATAVVNVMLYLVVGLFASATAERIGIGRSLHIVVGWPVVLFVAVVGTTIMSVVPE
jgi:hypothetical protein